MLLRSIGAEPPPHLARICVPLPHRLETQTSWLETSDHVRLYAFRAGSGSTGVVLAHESPGGLCGWLPAVPTFTAHHLRVLAFDFRGFEPSASAPNRSADDFAPDLQAAVDALHADGTSKVFVPRRSQCEEDDPRRRFRR